MWSIFGRSSKKFSDSDPAPSNDHHQSQDPHDALTQCVNGILSGQLNGSPLCQDEIQEVRKFDANSSSKERLSNKCSCSK